MGRTLFNNVTALVVMWFLQVGAKQVKVLATDARIAFSFKWYEPLTFDRVPAVDGFTAGGPNSSLCALGDVSRLSKYEGDQFTFTFHGVSASLVMASRADHSPFSVTYDGATYVGNTYSKDIACGAAWTSPVSPGTVAAHHTITGTNHPVDSGRTFLQLLSIVYDDGSSGDSEAGGVGAGGSSHRTTATPSASASSSQETTTATGTRTSASVSTRSSSSSPAHSTTVTTNPRPWVGPTGAAPNRPAGSNGGGGSTYSAIASTGPLQTSPVPTTDIGRVGDSDPAPQQNKASESSPRLTTGAVAGIAVTSGLSCLALAWILWTVRRRCFARRMLSDARSESFEAVLSEGAGLDGDATTRDVEPLSPGSSSFVIGSQGSAV